MEISTEIRDILETVMDPEVPVLSVIDMGIIRNVKEEGKVVTIDITPTYTGCPAMQMIEMNIQAALEKEGFRLVLNRVIHPPWTTDWMTEKGKDKLKEYGIAPPVNKSRVERMLFEKTEVSCPRCQSFKTHVVSEFGSTACKALYVCDNCKEPFDYFKCH